MTFWYAFAAARFAPQFVDDALGSSFQNYSRDPRKNNTVPGQFSEWLHGETLVNEGMMLSPWFPPRYLWAAIEGMAGVDHNDGVTRVRPRLAPNWKWMGLQELPYRGRLLTLFVARMPDVRMYTNGHFQESDPYLAYDEDISRAVRVSGEGAAGLGLRQREDLVLFVGNTAGHTITAALRVDDAALSGAYRQRIFNSLRGEWIEEGELLPTERLRRGITVTLESGGFCIFDLKQAV